MRSARLCINLIGLFWYIMNLVINAKNSCRDVGRPSSCNASQLPPFLVYCILTDNDRFCIPSLSALVSVKASKNFFVVLVLIFIYLTTVLLYLFSYMMHGKTPVYDT